MSFDIDVVVDNMGFAIIDAAKDDVIDIKNYSDTILKNKKESLKELGAAMLANEISDDIFNSELEREKKVVEAELLTIKLMSQAVAQKAVNSAINVFVNAVKAAV